MKQDSFDYTTVLAGNKSHVHKALVWITVILRDHVLQPTRRGGYILLVVLLVKQFYLASTYSYVDDSYLDVEAIQPPSCVRKNQPVPNLYGNVPKEGWLYTTLLLPDPDQDNQLSATPWKRSSIPMVSSGLNRTCPSMFD